MPAGGLLRRLAERRGWAACGALGAGALILGSVLLLGAHATRPIRTDGRIVGYDKVTDAGGSYLRNELQLAGDPETYILDKSQFQPALPEQLYANGKVTLWVDAGTPNVVAITLYDQDDLHPQTYTTDTYTHPAQALWRQLALGGLPAGVGLALLILAVARLRQGLGGVNLAARVRRAPGGQLSGRPASSGGRMSQSGPGHEMYGQRGSSPHAREWQPGQQPTAGAWEGLPPRTGPGQPATYPGYGPPSRPAGGARPQEPPGVAPRQSSGAPQPGSPYGSPPAPPNWRTGQPGPPSQPGPPAPPGWGPPSQPGQPGPPGQMGWGRQDGGYDQGRRPGQGPSQSGWGEPPRR
jgi:hypothetical protein